MVNLGGRGSLSDPCFTRNDLFAFLRHRTRNRLAGTAVRVKKIAFISIQVPSRQSLKQGLVFVFLGDAKTRLGFRGQGTHCSPLRFNQKTRPDKMTLDYSHQEEYSP